ncbi:hypothetical protein PROFUN_09032 [Planoprotostelium fungivorum]|uniref:MADS-box domain-containing protein n=1 Tax=Planoprotostelium fungivorum TaxID=1890364 RepID=A0A2P6MV74_9EUKA|nr:hypothetical protein PROFUN_09032 [Planoprotostelium fungivorum]
MNSKEGRPLGSCGMAHPPVMLDSPKENKRQRAETEDAKVESEQQESDAVRQDEIDEEIDSTGEEGDKDDDKSPKRVGKRKINIEFIENRSKRHVTFSKRKQGLIKKAFELSTLTGTQVLLVIASEIGNVYTFATPKLQPIINKKEGMEWIQSCLDSDPTSDEPPAPQKTHKSPSPKAAVTSTPAPPASLYEQHPTPIPPPPRSTQEGHRPFAGQHYSPSPQMMMHPQQPLYTPFPPTHLHQSPHPPDDSIPFSSLGYPRNTHHYP